MYRRAFPPNILNHAVIVIAATDDRGVNQHVSEIAKALRIPVNVVDDPEFCSFIMPSVIDRSPVIVAVSSGGASPVLARLLRATLETLIPAAYGRLAHWRRNSASQVKKHFTESGQRRIFWEKAFQGPVAEMVLRRAQEQATSALRAGYHRRSSRHPAARRGLPGRRRPGQPRPAHFPRPAPDAAGRRGRLRQPGFPGRFWK